jgi:GTP cyclohydrolase I
MNAPNELFTLQDDLSETDAQQGRPMSQVIRERLQAEQSRFFANDNIAAAIQSDAELSALQAEVADKMREVLRSLVIDIDHDHNSADTAERVAKMFVREVFSGRYQPAPSVTAFPNVEHVNELIVVGPITVRSACSHHMCPIMGKLWVGILPKAESKLIGLSKYARIADWIMSRPQIQEEAVKHLADHLETEIEPAGLAVVVKANHFCMHWRGVKDESQMTSSVMRGQLHESQALRQEFLSLVNLQS